MASVAGHDQSDWVIQRTPILPTSEKPAKFRVYLIDDHPLVLQGVTELINAESDLQVVGSTGEWSVAFEQIKELQPALVVLDITLSRSNGIEILKNLRVHFPKLKVLILSMHDEDLYAMRALKAGAHGYLMKASASEEVVLAVRKILEGEIYLSPRIAKQTMLGLLGRRKEQTVTPLDDLSDRELEVFQMVGDGLTTRQMAERMHLSVKTVETHKSHIKEKLHIDSATQLVQHAVQAQI